MKGGGGKVTRDRLGWLIASPAGLGAFIVGTWTGSSIHVFGEYPSRANAEQHAKDVNAFGHGARVWARDEINITYTPKESKS